MLMKIEKTYRLKKYSGTGEMAHWVKELAVQGSLGLEFDSWNSSEGGRRGATLDPAVLSSDLHTSSNSDWLTQPLNE